MDQTKTLKIYVFTITAMIIVVFPLLPKLPIFYVFTLPELYEQIKIFLWQLYDFQCKIRANFSNESTSETKSTYSDSFCRNPFKSKNF